MDVILREDVPDLGRVGDIVSVSPGYARNYLIPQALAVEATRRNLKQLEHQKRVLAKHAERKRAATASLAEKVEGLSVTVAKPVGSHDRLYGSVTQRDIVRALAEEGIDQIDRKQIKLPEPIRQLGIFPIEVRLDADHTVEIKVWVVAKE